MNIVPLIEFQIGRQYKSQPGGAVFTFHQIKLASISVAMIWISVIES